MSKETTAKSLLERLIDGVMEPINKMKTTGRIDRAFASSSDSLDNQLEDVCDLIDKAREALVNSAKNRENLSSHINGLVELNSQKLTIEATIKALTNERNELFEVK